MVARFAPRKGGDAVPRRGDLTSPGAAQ